MGRTRYLILMVLCLCVIGTRVPLRSQMLYDFDSIAFASGVEHFDVSNYTPHPPGYPLYILSAKILNLAFQDANRSLGWLSVLASGLTVLGLGLLGTAVFSFETGVLAGLLLAASPLFWVFGEVALSYSPGVLFSTLVALYLWKSRQGEEGAHLKASVLLAVGGGFRPDLLIVLAPLWVFCMRDLSRREAVFSALVCPAITLGWLAVTILLSGGWDAYMEVVSLQKLGVERSPLLVNAAKILAYSAWGLGCLVAALPLLLRKPFRLRLKEDGRGLFCLIWMTPYVLLTTLVAFGQPGMLLVIFPCICLLVAEAVRMFTERPSRNAGHVPTSRGRIAAAALVCLFLNGFLFLKAPFLKPDGFLRDRASFLEKVNTEFFLLSAQGVRFLDRYYGSLFSTIRAKFPATETLVLTNWAGWVHAAYYLDGYDVRNYFLFYGVRSDTKNFRYLPEGTFEIPQRVRYVVLFNGSKHSIRLEDTLGPYNRAGAYTRRIETPEGYTLDVLDVPPGARLRMTGKGFYLEPSSG